jgi:hypothetical protein
MAANWADYCIANEADGGHLQALCEKDNLSKLAQLAKGLLGDADDNFACTLNSSDGANVIMIPSGRPNEVQFFTRESLPVNAC